MVMIAAVLGIGLGVWLIADDLESSSDFLDGLGIVMGLFLIGCCGFILLLSATALLFVSKYPQISAWMSCVVLAPAGLAFLAILGNRITIQSLIWALVLLGGGVGWIALCASSGSWPRRAPAEVSVDQPVFPFSHRSTT